MISLRRVRLISLLALLAVSTFSNARVSADPSCDDYDLCQYCDTAPGECVIPVGGGSCDQWAECSLVGFCSGNTGGSGTICNCGPCS
jgi:hypothetical protein